VLADVFARLLAISDVVGAHHNCHRARIRRDVDGDNRDFIRGRILKYGACGRTVERGKDDALGAKRDRVLHARDLLGGVELGVERLQEIDALRLSLGDNIFVIRRPERRGQRRQIDADFRRVGGDYDTGGES